jgi:hypothetical protein
MILRNILHSLVFFILIVSCGNSISPSEYIAYVDSEENGLVKIWTQNDLELTCQFLPHEYIALKQFNKSTLKKEPFFETLAEIDSSLQFKLTFENKAQNNFLKNNYTTGEEYNRSVMYLSYDIGADLTLVKGVDSVKCSLFHHERTYGNTPYETLLISFASKFDDTDQLQLIFRDRVFGFGTVKFLFKTADIRNVPILDFSVY